MSTEEIVLNVRDWVISKVQDYDVDRMYDKMALMQEFDEWFNPEEDLDVISLDYITQEQYNDYVDLNDGIERA